MIALIKWTIRFIVWILLYYVITIKIAKIIVSPELAAMNNFNLFILSVSIGMSFMSSFWNKLISWKNIKYHGYSVLIIVFLPLLFKILNYGIEFINWSSKLVNAPDIGLIKFNIYIEETLKCGCHELNEMGMTYLVITSLLLLFFFVSSYEMYYWNPKVSYLGDCWDDDLD